MLNKQEAIELLNTMLASAKESRDTALREADAAYDDGRAVAIIAAIKIVEKINVEPAVTQSAEEGRLK